MGESASTRECPGLLRITVGMGTCGLAAGAGAVFELLRREMSDRGVDGSVVRVGCRGLCSLEPLVEVFRADGKHEMYGKVDEETARAIVASAVSGEAALQGDADCGDESDAEGAGAVLRSHLVEGDPFAGQTRRVLSNCGVIDPFSLDEYRAHGGYETLARVLEEGAASRIVDEVESSGLRGRGGAGFSTGRKWRSFISSDAIASEETGGVPMKYFIVNGDEGDPGAYMDRGLLESDPHRVLEGLLLSCYATGARKAYFFIRAEYALAVKTIRHAVDEAYSAGLLGENILGSGYSLDVGVVRGAGAFLCGESTAMVNVLEGKACTTRPKPPHMTEKGLWGAPTCINNVETLANVPLIVERGAEWFRSVGTEESPGTKVLSVAGSAENVGLAEVAMGVTLGEIVDDIACAKEPKAVQIGGPSGAILPVGMSDIELTFEGLAHVGGMMGSGGFVVLSQRQCVVETALFLTTFSRAQSCLKCKLCREGMEEAASILRRLCEGVGEEADLARLEELASACAADKSLCGLGRMGLNPMITSLRHFPDEYRAHMKKTCPAHACRDLISYVIDPAKCQGERCCLLTCPGNAIRGPFGKPSRIVERLCQKCGSCVSACCYGAVKTVSPRP